MIFPIKHTDKANCLQRIKRLSRLSFLDYPVGLQIIIVVFFGIFLFWLFNMKILHERLESMQNEHRIQNLVQTIDRRKKLIEEVKQYKNDSNFEKSLNRIDFLHSVNFIRQISTLAKKEQVEIQAIKPIVNVEKDSKGLQGEDMSIRSLQVEMTGKYSNIISFLLNVSKLTVLIAVGDFQIVSLSDSKKEMQLPVNYFLKLTATLYLYEHVR